MRVLAQAIKEAASTDATKLRDTMKKLKFTPVHGKEVAFDDHNQAGKYVVLQSVKDRKVVVAGIVEVK
jgi:branched-chain amino acid transport system substrate-binding protein